ncbi:molybdate ABC transporter substrate-binding protein [Psychromonas sp.]|nr:molybdate ABC transporter substrate-binding protein [Psychromonas sp.]
MATLNIAVASNFKVTAQQIAHTFTENTGVEVNISSASTATLYQQILRGAPFDLFLSADEKHIDLLVATDKMKPHTKFIYAQGQLVFWQPNLNRIPTLDDFTQFNERLAIANPKFAPYGIAAQQTLEFLNKWQTQAYVKGNNINQTYQFVESNNVAAGLVALASVLQQKKTKYVIIPQQWYQPIKQAGIVLNNHNQSDAEKFREFVLSNATQVYIHSQGYD